MLPVQAQVDSLTVTQAESVAQTTKQITNVRLDRKEGKLFLTLVTSDRRPLQPVVNQVDNVVTVTVSGQLALVGNNSFEQLNPIVGVRSVQAKQISPDQVQISIMGRFALPIVNLVPDPSGLIVQIESSDVAETEDEEEEVFATGQSGEAEVAGNQTVITADELRRRQAGTVRDLLRYEPGISVPSDNRGGLQGINIRGLDGNRVDLRVDGIRLPAAFTFGVTRLGRDYIDLETLNALTIFRGTSSGITDSAALGGTVSFETATARNLLDRLGKNSYTSLRSLYSSSSNSIVGTLTQANRFDQLDTLFIYTRRDGGDFRIRDERFRDDTARSRNNFLGKLNYQFNPQSRLELTGEIFDDDVSTQFSTANLPGMVFEGTTQNLVEDRLTNRQRISLGYELDDPKNPSWLQFARAFVYYQNAQVEEESDRTVFARGRISQDQAEKEFIDRSVGGQLQLRSDFRLGTVENRLTYGFDISSTYNERNDVRFDIRNGSRILQAGYPRKDYPDSTTFRLGLFAQNEILLDQGRLRLIPALRFDAYNLNVSATPEFLQKREQPVEFSQNNLSPSFGIIYQPSSSFTLFGRYSRGFRPPLYSELNTSFRADIPVRPHKGIPNPNLEAETSNNFELGFRSRSRQFDLDLTGFYSRYKNFIEANTFVGFDFNDISFGVPFQIIQSTNVSRAEIYGLELKTTYRFSPNPGGFYLRGALGWQYGNDLSANRPLPTIEPLKAVIGLGYQDSNDRWGIEVIATIVARAREQADFVSIANQTFRNPRSVLIDPYEPPAYTLFDLVSYYNVTPTVSLTFGVYNLFDTEYYQYGDVRSIDRNSATFEAQRGRSGQAGRNFALGLNWQF